MAIDCKRAFLEDFTLDSSGEWRIIEEQYSLKVTFLDSMCLLANQEACLGRLVTLGTIDKIGILDWDFQEYDSLMSFERVFLVMLTFCAESHFTWLTEERQS